MQVYYMKRNRIPIPFATVILMIITITYKAVLVAVGVWLMLFDRMKGWMEYVLCFILE